MAKEIKTIYINKDTDPELEADEFYRLRENLTWSEAESISATYGIIIETRNFITGGQVAEDKDRAQIKIAMKQVYINQLVTYIVGWSHKNADGGTLPINEQTVQDAITPAAFRVLREYIKKLNEKNGINSKTISDEKKVN